MPPKKVRQSASERARREMEAAKRDVPAKYGGTPLDLNTPGAGDQELYPTDRGAVDFRLATRRQKRRSSTDYA